MEHTAAAAAALASYLQMHQNQNTNPNPLQPQPHPISTSLYSSYYYPPPPPPAAADPQNQRVTTQFYTTDPTTSLTPPGVDPYTTYPHLPYYFDPNSNTWVAKEAVRQYGSTPAAFPAPVVSGWSSFFHFFSGLFFFISIFLVKYRVFNWI